MTEKNTSGRGQRDLRVRVKTAKGRKLSSTLWLERQLNDPYVIRAKKEGYRGRAAYKILELDDKYGFLDRALDRMHGRVDVDDDAALEPVRRMRTDADDLDRLAGRMLADDGDDLGRSDIEADDQVFFVLGFHDVGNRKS